MAGYVFVLTSNKLLQKSHFHIGKARNVTLLPFNCMHRDALYLVNKWFVEDAVECRRLLHNLLRCHQVAQDVYCIRNYYQVLQYMRGMTLGRKRPLNALVKELLPDVYFNGRYFIVDDQPLSVAMTQERLQRAVRTTFTDLERRLYSTGRIWRSFQRMMIVAALSSATNVENWLDENTKRGVPTDYILMRNIYARMVDEQLSIDIHAVKLGLRRWAKKNQLPFLRQYRAVTNVKLL